MKRTFNKMTSVLIGGGLTLFMIFGLVDHARALTLNRGDILVAAVGAIIRVDPTTGAQTVISSGVNLVGPTGLARDRAGDILVTDVIAGAVIRVNPATGGQSVISSGGFFVSPFDLTIDATGQLLVADVDAFGGTGGIIRVNPVTGAQTVVSSGGNFLGPTGIALDATGQILVADVDAFGGTGGIIRVNPATGAQTVVSAGGNFIGPVRVVVDAAGQIIVCDHASYKIIRVDPVTGAQTVISSGGSLTGPNGLTLDATGQILVTFDDPNATSTGVVRVDPVTGAQTVISSGGSLVHPHGIAVVALVPGDILVADASAVGGGGAVIRVDPVTGAQSIISSGGNFVDPMGITVDPRGQILVADAAFGGTGKIIRVNPLTGAQTVVSSGDLFMRPVDLAIDATGQILVVDADGFGPDPISGGTGGVIRVDPVTGAQTAVSSGGNFHGPTGITLDVAGQILIADVDFGGSPGVSGPGAIIRVDPLTGAQTVVSSGGNFVGPVRVAVGSTGQLFVSDQSAFGAVGGIFQVDPVTGAQTIIYSGGGFPQGLQGLTLDGSGQILVAFRGHPNFDVPDGVARIDPVTGAVTVISSGGNFVNPVGIVVVAGSPTAPNAPPEVGALSSIPAAVGDSVVIAIGSSVSFSAPWTDPNMSDTHTALCDIVDVSGTTAATAVAGAAPGSGSGTATCNVMFSSTGIFSVTLTVTDQEGASGASTAIQVVVYDSSAGFVTGGGWFTPDPQTCICTPGSKATFGFMSQYKKGTSIPTGNQEFQYKADNINLHSTSFDWLVVSGPQAQFQGTGTINGAGAYKFRVTVRDGDLIGQPDRFEIRILPAGSTDFGGTQLWKGGNDLTGSNGAGSIVIHK